MDTAWQSRNRTARSVWSARSLLPLSELRRPKSASKLDALHTLRDVGRAQISSQLVDVLDHCSGGSLRRLSALRSLQCKWQKRSNLSKIFRGVVLLFSAVFAALRFMQSAGLVAALLRWASAVDPCCGFSCGWPALRFIADLESAAVRQLSDSNT